MTILEKLQSMSVEELAKILLKYESCFDDCGGFYVTTNGQRFYEDYEGALDYEIEWLNSECNDESIDIY